MTYIKLATLAVFMLTTFCMYIFLNIALIFLTDIFIYVRIYTLNQWKIIILHAQFNAKLS